MDDNPYSHQHYTSNDEDIYDVRTVPGTHCAPGALTHPQARALADRAEERADRALASARLILASTLLGVAVMALGAVGAIARHVKLSDGARGR